MIPFRKIFNSKQKVTKWLSLEESHILYLQRSSLPAFVLLPKCLHIWTTHVNSMSDTETFRATISENPDGGTPAGCFNQTLLSAERVGKTLSRSLQMFSTSHQNHTDRLSTVQFYLTEYKYRFGYCLHIPEIFNHSTRRAFMLFPDRYRHYSGDVLASLDATSYFAFFPEDYSSRRFKNIFQPTEVHFFPLLSNNSKYRLKSLSLIRFSPLYMKSKLLILGK